MLRKLVTLMVVVCIGIPFIGLFVANRHPVNLNLNPFDIDSPVTKLNESLSIYLVAALIAGVIVGGLATWLTQSKWRRTARLRTQEAYKWKNESERLIKERDAQFEAQRQAAAETVPQLAKAS